jgi:hypothetical protein
MSKYDIKVLVEAETSYGRYRVVEMIYNDRPARVLFSGPHFNAQSGLALDEHPRLLFDYNQRFMEIVDTVGPKSVLVLGGGAYTFPTAVRKNVPAARVVAVERDDILAEIAEQFFELDAGVEVVHDDVVGYLATNEEQFDVVVMDVFAGDTIPAELMRPKAIADIERSLSEAGVVAVNLIGAIHGPGAGATNDLLDTYRLRFDDVQIAPASIGASVWGRQNLVLQARKRA